MSSILLSLCVWLCLGYPGFRKAVFGLQVPEQAVSQAHPREVAPWGPLHPRRRSGY